MKVKKERNSIEEFQIGKIQNAVEKAFAACNREYHGEIVGCVEEKFSKYADDVIIDSSEIQDEVEKCLMMYSPEIAKAYIISCHEHRILSSNKDKLMRNVKKKLMAEDIENQNANMDEYSFGGRMNEATRVVTKEYALNSCMSKKSKRQHVDNQIYIHDLDSYSVGEHNCAEYNSWIKIIDKGMPKMVRIGELADQLGIGPGKIGDITKRGIQILSRDGWAKLINISCRETLDEEPIYTIRTRKGMPLKLTEKHRLPIFRNGKECIEEVKNIKVGDELIDIEGISLSSEEYSSDFIDLTQLNDDKVDIRIINLEPLRSYLRYRYGVQFTDIHRKRGYNLEPHALSMKLCDFLDLMDQYPLTYDVLSMLRIKSCGSKHNFPLHIPYSADLAKLYAYIYADGGVYVSEDRKLFQLTFTNKRKEMVIDFIDTFERVFGYRLGLQKPGSWSDVPNNVVYRTTSSSRILCKMFKNFAGAKKYGANDISIPYFVINGNETIKYAFLSAALDSDGCLGEKLTYSSCCKRYCEQLKLMLDGMGYHSSVVSMGHAGDVYRFGKKSGVRNFDSFNVLITRNDEIARLYENTNTLKKNDSYVYRGFNNHFNEQKITSISKEYAVGTKVYDVETSDHWFIVNNVVSHNCNSVPFDHLLSDGFTTRQADVRPAKSINTAMQLVAVLFQSQSLQQFGGVSSTHLDWTMVPYVRYSFFKHFRDGFELLCDGGFDEYGVDSTMSIDDARYKNEEKVYNYALNMTKRELKQAVEGLYHNLNTIQSRVGGQLPFTSINYGTCTLTEGRMVTRALIEGSISGVGKYHKTAIFPCGIFQCKKGINRYEGEPNYDLFRLALKSTAQRIYPNYANCDVSMQKSWIRYDRDMKKRVIGELSSDDYGKLVERLTRKPELCDQLFLNVLLPEGKLEIQEEEKPYEIFSTMGCVCGKSVIHCFWGKGNAFTCTFEELWEKLSKSNEVKEQIEGVRDFLYIDPTDLSIREMGVRYVDVKRVIRNTSVNWVNIVLEDGHSLRCTIDHPLETDGLIRKAGDFKAGETLTVCFDRGGFERVPIASIEFSEHEDYSYDVETETGYFQVNGIYSHNCRTVNGADINAEISYRTNIKSVIDTGKMKDNILSAAQKDGRGNICPVTIILPTIAMEADRNKENFMKLLDEKLYCAKDMLIERYEWICKQSPLSASFMWENNTMHGYIPEEGTQSALRHGTLVIGQLGLAETLILLIGKDQTTREGMELAKEIEELYRKRCNEFKEEYKLNFGVYYTPAENLCYTALKKFRDKYGIIEGVSDRMYFTNSIHVPVWKSMTPFDKIDIESQLTGYSSAGCITYVELDSGVKNNIDAMETIVSYALDKDIPYFAINVPIDDCNDCGYSGDFGNKCPMCGSENISQLKRVTGYLTGDYKTAFNKGKQFETEERVRHIIEVSK